MNPAIAVRNLRVVRGGRRVLENIDLSVAAGSITGIIGPSGSGKTTLIRALAGVQANVDGQVSILGSPAGSSTNRRRLAYLTQNGSVYPDLTAAQNVRHFARLSSVPLAHAADALTRVNLLDRSDQLVSSMSGGQRARVGLASVLVTGADVLLLDEPTVGLDPLLRQQLWQLFAELAADGTTLLVSSHVMDEAARCDQIILLREGRILANDTPAELRTMAGVDDLDAAFIVLAQQEQP